MALSHTLPIYIDTYKLILLIFERTSNFGREYKYTLCQDMKRDGINLVRSIHRANRSKEKHYKFLITSNFRIKSGIAILPHLIEFKTR